MPYSRIQPTKVTVLITAGSQLQHDTPRDAVIRPTNTLSPVLILRPIIGFGTDRSDYQF